MLKILNVKIPINYDFDPVKLLNIINNADLEQKSRKTPATTLDKLIKITQQFIDKTTDFEEYKSLYITKEGTLQKFAASRDYLVAEQQAVYNYVQYRENKAIFDDTMALFDLAAAFALE